MNTNEFAATLDLASSLVNKWMCIDETKDVATKQYLPWTTSEAMSDLFDTPHPLAFQVREFISSVAWHSGLSSTIIVAGLYIMARIRGTERYRVTRNTFCILFSTCMWMASKYHDDAPLNVNYWSHLTALPASYITTAERSLLRLLDWRIYHTAEDLQQFTERETARRHGRRAMCDPLLTCRSVIASSIPTAPVSPTRD
eukprot:EC724309.1.p1 GENE.EC724309.1~~EC724309.1.p1  ORF type:complete len:211 (+),score=31.86 EC724309.1:39-635(+)